MKLKPVLEISLAAACLGLSLGAAALPPGFNPQTGANMDNFQLSPAGQEALRRGGQNMDPYFLLRLRYPNLALTGLQSPATAVIDQQINVNVSVRNPSTEARVDSALVKVFLSAADLTGRAILPGRDPAAMMAETAAAPLGTGETRNYPVNIGTRTRVQLNNALRDLTGNAFVCAWAIQRSPNEPLEIRLDDNVKCNPITLNEPPPPPAQYCRPGAMHFEGRLDSTNGCDGRLSVDVLMGQQGRFNNGTFHVTPDAGANCQLLDGVNLQGNLNRNATFSGDMRDPNPANPNPIIHIEFDGITNVPDCTTVSGRFSTVRPRDGGTFRLNR